MLKLRRAGKAQSKGAIRHLWYKLFSILISIFEVLRYRKSKNKEV
jgi:hypothetical protein